MNNNEFKFDRMPAAYSTGGAKCVLSEEAIQRQSGAVWDMLKQFGFLAFSSIGGGGGDKDLISISLPVRIFEPRSYLQRIADGWWSAPIYLTNAAKANAQGNHIEALKNVITFVISGLHNTCNQDGKPFNPILGETFEAKFEDGAEIFCEQSSHHPPITNWQVIGPSVDESGSSIPSYHYYGFGEWKASLKLTGNYVEGQQQGPNVVSFSDGTKILFTLPKAFFRGLIRGDRIIEYEGVIRFVDKKNGLRCDLHINPPEEVAPSSGGWLRNPFGRKAKPPTDYVKGDIVRITPEDNTKTEEESKNKTEEGSEDEDDESEDEEDGEVLCKVEGTWMGCLDFDGKRFWDWKDKNKKYEPIVPETALPSDSRYRKDLLELLAGNIDSAQEWKNRLENKQRKEKTLREEGRKERGETSSH